MEREKLNKINIKDYDFLDLGCGTADGYYHVKKIFGKHKGLGVDIDKEKINKAQKIIAQNKELKENYTVICDDVKNFTKNNINNNFQFSIAIHFLEHLPGYDITREILYSALCISKEFVYIIEPFFDLDAQLLKIGLKTYYSDWSEHKNLLTSLQFYRLGRDFLISDNIKDFVIFGIEPITDSSSPYILPINAPVNSHEYNSIIHPPKNNNIKFKGLYKDIGVFFLKKDNIPIENYLDNRNIKWSVLYDSRIDYKEQSINESISSTKETNIMSTDSYNKIKPDESDLMENIRKHMRNDTIQSYNEILQILKQVFVNQKPASKNDTFNSLKELVSEAVINLDRYDDIIESTNKNNRDFFEYILNSIQSNDEKVLEAKNRINLDILVSVVVYIKDNFPSEINNLYNSIVRQSIGIEHLNIIFIDNNSTREDTRRHLDELSNTYHNVDYLKSDESLPKYEVYNSAMNYSDSQYIIFTDKKHILPNSAIKDIFRAIRMDNMNLAIGTHNNHQLPLTSIYSKLFKKKFIDDNNIKFKSDCDGECVLDDEVLKLNGILYTDVVVIKR